MRRFSSVFKFPIAWNMADKKTSSISVFPLAENTVKPEEVASCLSLETVRKSIARLSTQDLQKRKKSVRLSRAYVKRKVVKTYASNAEKEDALLESHIKKSA